MSGTVLVLNRYEEQALQNVYGQGRFVDVIDGVHCLGLFLLETEEETLLTNSLEPVSRRKRKLETEYSSCT